MNVGVIGYFGQDTVDGCSYAAFQIAKWLARNGHAVTMFYHAGLHQDYQDESGIRHLAFPKPKHPFALHPDFLNAIKSPASQIDIFHIHSVFIPQNYAAARALQSLSIPYVLTPNGGYNSFILGRKPWLKSLYKRLFEAKTVKKAAGMVAVASPEVNDFRAYGFEGPVRVIPNPVPVQDFQPIASEGEDGIRLVYLGRYDADHKGLFFMLETFRHLRALDPGAQLALYGKGPDKDRLSAFVRAHRLEGVTINDPVFGDQKLQAYHWANAYLQTSKWEAFGVSIAEAMLLGRTPFLSEGCYLAPLLAENNAGVRLPGSPETAAQTIHTFFQSQTREQILASGAKARAFAEARFSLEAVGAQILDFYTSLLPVPVRS